MDAVPTGPRRPTSLRKKYLERYFFRPQKPVSWLNPLQLAGTGVQVFLAERLGAYLDKRELQGIFEQPPFDERGSGQGVWFDFVADTGDGFNATYAVARQLAKPTITVDKQPLQRGQFLIMGGDQVYPTPSPTAYEQRLRGPFAAALPNPESDPQGPSDPPRLYALPGNHDWYDGLTAFFRVFAGADSAVGDWLTQQKRSYFAIRLPGNWWLFALDAQHGTHIDDPQLNYFHDIIANHVQEGAQIILCTPEPGWVQSKHVPDAYASIDYFLGKVISVEGQQTWLTSQSLLRATRSVRSSDPGGSYDAASLTHGATQFPDASPKPLTVPLMLSGDWHHYSHYVAVVGADQRHLITAGGGGAYLYGTHRLPYSGTMPPEQMQRPQTASSTYRFLKAFPGRLTSVWLGLGALVRVPLRNWAFVLFLGILQTTLFYALQRREAGYTLTPSVLLIVLLIVGLVGFVTAGLSADKRWRWIIPIVLIHSSAQIALAAVGAMYWPDLLKQAREQVNAAGFVPWVQDTLTWLLTDSRDIGASLVLYGIVAGIASSVLVAIFFFIGSLVNINFNELFSGQRIEGYKNFVRLHIDASGDLTVHAIGLRRVRRLGPAWLRWQWRIPRRAGLYDSWFVPRGRDHRPQLIEKFTIAGRREGA